MKIIIASSIERMSPNCSGLMNWSLCAYSAPASPVIAADSANDTVL